jgi:formamidopyrimidine-DNA glycosylase
MPELPDVEIFSKNLDKIFAGRKLLKIKVINGKKCPNTARNLQKIWRKNLRIYRSGKELRFEFSDGTLAGLHLMLTGDIFVFEGKNDHHSTIIELYFEGDRNLALTDRMRNAQFKLNPVDKGGVDALELDYKYLKTLFNRSTTIKNIMLDQDLIRGISNGYSDKFFWETNLSLFCCLCDSR